MKTGVFYLGLILSVLAIGMVHGASEPEGVPWAEWRFTSDFDTADEITADKASDPDSLVRRNPASAAISVSGGKVVFTQTGPDDLGDNNYNAAELWVAVDGSVGSGSYSDPGVVPLETWVRLVVVRRLEGTSWVRDLYVDGTKVLEGLGAEGLDGNSSLYTKAQRDEGQFTIISDSDATPYAGCELDNFAFVAAALSGAEIADLGRYSARGIFGVTGLASEPTPADEATDVLRDSDLSWIPAETAQTHDVYFGTNWDDVNDADRANPLDILLSQDQSGTLYDPGRLEFGRSYYWRVDEVNGAPDYTVFKGSVWSFTVEPFTYPIADISVTSNAISGEGTGPENTVNGSGLNADDQHSTVSGDMWLASPAGADPLQIEYEFDGIYKLHEMLVWNYNVQFELLLGFGAKDVTVEYSENGADWTVLGDIELAQATASADYEANTTIDFGGVAVHYVRLTVNSGFGASGQFGLSEVRFLYLPAHARQPEPADGAAEVSIDAVLGWRSGREAALHEVYLSADETAVSNGTALVDTVEDTRYAPDGLELASTYYWKVNEVNEAEPVSTWDGAIWSFATEEFIVIDDFEGYDDEDNLIYESWADGWVNETGSTVGYLEAPFAEQTTVHSGRQSMPLFYDNTTTTTSEADLTLAEVRNWTRAGITTLTLYLRGEADNGPGQFYVKIDGFKVPFGDAEALTLLEWQPWGIDLASVSTNLTNVGTLTLGIEGSGSGLIYIDDIRLY